MQSSSFQTLCHLVSTSSGLANSFSPSEACLKVQKLEIGRCDEGWLRLELGGVLLVVWCFQSLSGFPFIVALFIHHHTSSTGLSNNSVVTTVVLSQTGLMTFTETQTVSAFPQPRKPDLTFPAATRAQTMATGVILNLLAFVCCRF